jgi:two-component system, chemotaxis family, protein-glutamate methylesterase/glutaminase
MPELIRILIVDDSRIFRGVLNDALAELPGVAVVGSVWNGLRALEFLGQQPVDLVTLDIEMPGIGGLETLHAIQQLNESRPDRPPVNVLLVSAYTSEGAAVTIEGLQGGAFDFVTKPTGTGLAENVAYLREQLSAKLRVLRARLQRGMGERSPQKVLPARRSLPVYRARAIVIGVSTGGPAALAQLLPDLTARTSSPILIVQHMPAGFTKSLAESLARKCRRPVVEAEDKQKVERGTVYLAPGGRHMLVRSTGEGTADIALNDQAPQNNCRPSVDVLFRSAAAAYGPEAIGIILTGMGSDGMEGLAALHRAGAFTIAQDEATSVVWGMPGSAVAAGCVDQVLPLSEIAAAVQLRVAP